MAHKRNGKVNILLLIRVELVAVFGSEPRNCACYFVWLKITFYQLINELYFRSVTLDISGL